jgi:hypothetical protein
MRHLKIIRETIAISTPPPACRNLTQGHCLLGPRPVHAVPTAQALIDHAEAVAVALLDRFG